MSPKQARKEPRPTSQSGARTHLHEALNSGPACGARSTLIAKPGDAPTCGTCLRWYQTRTAAGENTR